MSVVDLRSDTVTRPTAEMRRAMAEAEVGDDVYREDPTVNALEEAFAARVGKDAALFVPSGVMGNQVALRLLTRPGQTVVAGRRQHVVVYENGAAGVNAGVQFTVVPDDDGSIRPVDLEWALDAANHHYPEVGLVCIENTHMPACGAPWDPSALEALGATARRAGVAVHLDGARLFHAEAATATPAATLAGVATTVMCCLSKGLCAPVGSLVAGPAAVMAGARRERQRLGGAMRQAGILAAAGLIALRDMVDRLPDDHRRARALADAVTERWPDGGLDPDRVRTNIVTWSHPRPAAVVEHLAGEGVLVGSIAPGVLRLVTHHDVDDAGVERARKAIASAP
jgi:threonine aldolase